MGERRRIKSLVQGEQHGLSYLGENAEEVGRPLWGWGGVETEQRR